MELNKDQLGMLSTNGFCVIRRITTLAELKSIRHILDLLVSRSYASMQADRSLLQIDMPIYEALELGETKFRANASRIARQVLGEASEWVGDQALFKPPGGRETPWHQDEAYWPAGYDYHAVSVWLALDRVDKRNGCLHFKTGSHRLQVLPHHVTSIIEGFPVLEVDQCPRSGTVHCALEPGDATIHWSRTLHFASRNRTKLCRRAYALGFGCPPLARA
jgi:hypothetical protein